MLEKGMRLLQLQFLLLKVRRWKTDNVVISTFIVLIVALSVFQIYVLRGVYVRKDKELKASFISRLGDVTVVQHFNYFNENILPILDTLCVRYKKNQIHEKELVDAVIELAQKYDKPAGAAMYRIAKKSGIDQTFKYAFYLDALAVMRLPDSAQFIVKTKNTDDLKLIANFNPEVDSADVHVSDFSWSSEHHYIRIKAHVQLTNTVWAIVKELFPIVGLMLITFIVVIALFISVYVLLIKQREQSQVKAAFINNITHEFKTPITTIQIASKTLDMQSRSVSTEYVNSLASLIDRQNNHLIRLIDDVIESRSLSERFTLKRETIDINQFLQNRIEDFCIQSHDKQFDIISHLSETPLEADIDGFYFTTLVYNLFNNSVKYKHPDRKCIIEVRTSTRHHELIIEIADNGRGIPAKELKHIFKQFYRGKSAVEASVKGLGLGLHYCQKIVAAHGGEILVSSVEHVGTRFTVIIDKKHGS